MPTTSWLEVRRWRTPRDRKIKERRKRSSKGLNLRQRRLRPVHALCSYCCLLLCALPFLFFSFVFAFKQKMQCSLCAKRRIKRKRKVTRALPRRWWRRWRRRRRWRQHQRHSRKRTESAAVYKAMKADVAAGCQHSEKERDEADWRRCLQNNHDWLLDWQRQRQRQRRRRQEKQ